MTIKKWVTAVVTVILMLVVVVRTCAEPPISVGASFGNKQHTRLQVEMTAAELYGFQFVPPNFDVPENE